MIEKYASVLALTLIVELVALPFVMTFLNSKRVDFLKLSYDELKFLSQEPDLHRGADWFLQKGVKIIVVTDGDQGCSYHTPKLFVKVPSFEVKVVDTVGCGDAFTAAMLQQLLLLQDQGLDIYNLDAERVAKFLKFESQND